MRFSDSDGFPGFCSSESQVLEIAGNQKSKPGNVAPVTQHFCKGRDNIDLKLCDTVRNRNIWSHIDIHEFFDQSAVTAVTGYALIPRA